MFEIFYRFLVAYSRVPNISVGGNKHVGRKTLKKIINVQVGINV